MINRFCNKQMLSMLVLVLTMSLTLSACEPLRKKFTRQKKKGDVQDQGFVPVLEPVDYPAPEDNPAENYKQHYALLKVFYKDMWTSLEAHDSSKSQRYNIKQVLAQIEEMQKLVVIEKQVLLQDLAKLLNYYNTVLDQAEPFRNESRIKSDLRAFDRLLRDQLRVDRLKGAFVSAKT